MIGPTPPSNDGYHPNDRLPQRRVFRCHRKALLWAVSILVLAVLAYFFWRTVLYVAFWYLIYIYMYLHTGAAVFVSLGAIVFAIGWCVPLWFGMTRRYAWRRASVLFALVLALHTGWFLFGWVAFYPPCKYDPGPGPATGMFTLVGDLDPAFADALERNLRDSLGEDAVRRSDAYTVLVRPVVGLLASRQNAELVFLVANGSPMPGPLTDRETGCMSVEQSAMRDGRAGEWRDGWGLWPWNTIRDDGALVRWLRGIYEDA